jgi:hypothetical protein
LTPIGPLHPEDNEILIDNLLPTMYDELHGLNNCHTVAILPSAETMEIVQRDVSLPHATLPTPAPLQLTHTINVMCRQFVSVTCLRRTSGIFRGGHSASLILHLQPISLAMQSFPTVWVLVPAWLMISCITSAHLEAHNSSFFCETRAIGV